MRDNYATAEARAEALRPALTKLVGQPLRAIAAQLDARGIATPTGKPWTAPSVRNTLLRLGLYRR